MSTNKIYVTGDTHCPIDISKLNSKNFHEGKTLTKDDYLIICGDAGLVWDGSAEDKWWQNWISEKPWTTLFVGGNHENWDLLNSYPVEKWHGGNVHKITDSLIHLMNGQIYTINGMKFFVMGGAESVDKIYRKEGKSWWAAEMPSMNEYNEALDNLEANDNEVDYIITHCGPTDLQNYLFPYYEVNQLNKFLEIIRTSVKYNKWFCGHYHCNKDLGKWQILYNDIIKI